MKPFGGDEEEKEGKAGAAGESEKGGERCNQMQTAAVGGAAEEEVDTATTSRNSRFRHRHIARRAHRYGSQRYGQLVHHILCI